MVSPTGNEAETFALAIDQLRLLRNSVWNLLSSNMDNGTFTHYMQFAKDAFTALRVPTNYIDALGGLTESKVYPVSFQRSTEDRRREFEEGNKFLEGDDRLDVVKNKEIGIYKPLIMIIILVLSLKSVNYE